jgi:DNA-binding NarL/FixJ family response regulator
LADVVAPGGAGRGDRRCGAQRVRALNGRNRLTQRRSERCVRTLATKTPARERSEREPLTRRELETLRLVARGRTNREIGRDLFLSPRTVEMHVRHVLAKLDCRSRTEATVKAQALGLLEPHAAG